MDEKPLDKSPEENQPSAQSNIEVGGNVGGNLVSGSNNTVNNTIINLPPEQQVFRSLHQLPQAPADFTGREELIAQLLADFEQGKGATITGQPIHGLIGMGGIGKTALGLVVAGQLKKDYPDAQIFLDLKGTTTPLSAIDIMRHVILSFEPEIKLGELDETGISTAYRSVLHGKKVLLLLDNARSAEQIAPLRPPESCALLVTSRWTFGVPGLKSHHIDVMSQKNAEKFLLDLCPRIGTQADELAKACAYLPLALRIVGSFLQVNDDYSIDGYLKELDDKKARLNTLGENREEAELRTEPDVVATFNQSYDQLAKENVDANIQKYWRTLGIFPTSFDSTALEVILGLDTKEAAKLVRMYKRYSLINFDETKMRYFLHDLLAAYALSQMENEEDYEARLKYASYYKQVLSRADSLYQEGGEKILTGLRLFDLEWENIQTAQSWVSQHTDRVDCLELCNEYPNAGSLILFIRQHPRERLAWFEKALQAARKLGNKKYEGYHLGNLGDAYYGLGEVHKAIDFHEAHLGIAREIGDRRSEGKALGHLGIAYRSLGEERKAVELYEKRLAIAREIGDRRGEGQVLGNLGTAYYHLGEVHKAIEFYQEQLAIAREIGDRHGEGRALGNLGNGYNRLGEARKAIGFQEQWLAIAREIGDRPGEGQALGQLGVAYSSLGEKRKAIEFYEQDLAISREIEDRRSEGISLRNLGIAYDNLGETREAIEFYEQSLAIAREMGNRREERVTLRNLGNAYIDLGDVRKAIEFYEQCLAIEREFGNRRAEGDSLFAMSLALHYLEEKDRAIDLMQQALEVYDALEAPDAEDARKKLKDWSAL